ncbi:hypothetical protein QJS10_CPB04g00691 [Acorus calamus]|uniref:Transmembrane protein n=1 Tax=Acorus calamus TaxID=4465 RepID=A0AAV9F1K3_ACOCL|nr:hypothetical protein QJS10_CPB04g00691 [Acorus calamus]
MQAFPFTNPKSTIISTSHSRFKSNTTTTNNNHIRIVSVKANNRRRRRTPRRSPPSPSEAAKLLIDGAVITASIWRRVSHPGPSILDFLVDNLGGGGGGLFRRRKRRIGGGVLGFWAVAAVVAAVLLLLLMGMSREFGVGILVGGFPFGGGIWKRRKRGYYGAAVAVAAATAFLRFLKR